MKLSTAGKYAIRAMFELAMRQGDGPVPAKEITRKQMIPFEYLEHLLGRLRKAGLVDSARGSRGGYSLSRTSGAIRVGDILRAVEGPLNLGSCAFSSSGKARCGRADDCVSRIIMVKVGSEISRLLDEMTLDDLRKEAGEARPNSKTGSFASCSL